MSDNTHYQAALEKERAKLEEELGGLGTIDPQNPGDWQVKAPTIDIMNADENEAADRAEELHIDSIVLDELKTRQFAVLRALHKLEHGVFGTCEICGATIETDRLDANPAARTCKADLDKEDGLAF